MAAAITVFLKRDLVAAREIRTLFLVHLTLIYLFRFFFSFLYVFFHWLL